MHRPIVLALSLATLAAVTPATGGEPPEHRTYGPWRSSYLGGGGYIQNVVPTNDAQRFYSYVDVGGAFRSDDGGHTWHQMLHGDLPARGGAYSVRGLIADPRDPDVVIIATGTQWAPVVGLMRSTDAGQSWQLVQEAVFFGNDALRTAGRILKRHPERPDVILAAAGGAIYRSTDNGATWTPVGPEGLLAHALTFDRRDADRVWLAASATSRWVGGERQVQYQGGFYHSTDAGQSWEKIDDTAPDQIVQDPADADRLWGRFGGQSIRVSDDDGRTWRPMMQGLPLGQASSRDGTTRALAAGPDRLLLATGNGDFFELPVAAERWQPVERQGITADDWWYGNYGQHAGWVHFGKEVTSITVNPHNHDEWFFTDWYAIWRSPDRGRNWQLSVDGIEVTVIHTLRQAPDDPQLVHLGMADNGYLRSTDGGATWTTTRGDGSPNNVKDIDLSPADPSRLYATGPHDHGWYANQLYISEDRGLSWRQSENQGLPEDLHSRRTNSVSVHPSDPQTVIIGVSGGVGPRAGGVYQSTDGGDTWRWIGQGLPESQNYFRTSIWAGGRELAISGDGSMVALSQDRGQVRFRPAEGDWQRVSISLSGRPFSVSADAQQPGRFYLGVTGDGMYRSDDGGQSWERVFRGDVYQVRADDEKADRVVIGTSAGVWLSEVAGEQPVHLGHELPYKERPFGISTGERVVVGTTGTGVYWRELPE